MKKIALAVIAAAFTTAALSAPVLAQAKKNKPGMCGANWYFDKKTKTCKSKG